MCNKADNPMSHGHSDYAKGIGAALLFALFVLAVGTFGITWRYDAAIGDLQRQQDDLECQIAPDETRCLRELVAGKK